MSANNFNLIYNNYNDLKKLNGPKNSIDTNIKNINPLYVCSINKQFKGLCIRQYRIQYLYNHFDKSMVRPIRYYSK